ncbi:uncharacterized protein BDW43DRAFT_261999 [Aspergillus alliaceus]|uniref:uncharacterized protein n=1 Tax=Petromyces alliaceus TaxID=209559 RepID=UPI0012A77428|nr:uncharacterized protein BDW43DRAFT_261999 [Aspergillus alliaceus]KAB8238542.1 hypothetical protein BDW43DRAFT_261999 [Aspergillus alliaceus]
MVAMYSMLEMPLAPRRLLVGMVGGKSWVSDKALAKWLLGVRHKVSAIVIMVEVIAGYT